MSSKQAVMSGTGQVGPHRSQSSTQTGHDDWLGGEWWQLHDRRLDRNNKLLTDLEVAQILGTLSVSGSALLVGPVDHNNQQMDLVRMHLLRRRNRVLSSLQRRNQLHKLLCRRSGAREQLKDVHVVVELLVLVHLEQLCSVSTAQFCERRFFLRVGSILGQRLEEPFWRLSKQVQVLNKRLSDGSDLENGLVFLRDHLDKRVCVQAVRLDKLVNNLRRVSSVNTKGLSDVFSIGKSGRSDDETPYASLNISLRASSVLESTLTAVVSTNFSLGFGSNEVSTKSTKSVSSSSGCSTSLMVTSRTCLSIFSTTSAMTDANSSASLPNACRILVTIAPVSSSGKACFQNATWIAIDAVRPLVASSSPTPFRSTTLSVLCCATRLVLNLADRVFSTNLVSSNFSSALLITNNVPDSFRFFKTSSSFRMLTFSTTTTSRASPLPEPAWISAENTPESKLLSNLGRQVLELGNRLVGNLQEPLVHVQGRLDVELEAIDTAVVLANNNNLLGRGRNNLDESGNLERKSHSHKHVGQVELLQNGGLGTAVRNVDHVCVLGAKVLERSVIGSKNLVQHTQSQRQSGSSRSKLDLAVKLLIQLLGNRLDLFVRQRARDGLVALDELQPVKQMHRGDVEFGEHVGQDRKVLGLHGVQRVQHRQFQVLGNGQSLGVVRNELARLKVVIQAGNVQGKSQVMVVLAILEQNRLHISQTGAWNNHRNRLSVGALVQVPQNKVTAARSNVQTV
ncbi:hypothetical protein OGAPHI_003886 [Ogataea philodendri]|uniref:Uncharacterized protein n=1 Tax=Ogataea philodendri TaxID=1378263 RepID=A0A9P8P565_9ASCO|nr:uncharacterized protein OGAPHI_003886 [Ogataea philodendri]KAH3665698.1 hypothetical protein OGAPHI_003886 [Ogataea philodendri]